MPAGRFLHFAARCYAAPSRFEIVPRESQMTIGVYVINLDRSKDRLEAIDRRLTAFGTAFERVPAFDGVRLDLATAGDYDAERAGRYMGRGLLGGEYGCYRSHIDAASRFLRSDARYALVLEDDALPQCDPLELLSKVLLDLNAVDPDWLLVNIGTNRNRIYTEIAKYEIEGREYGLRAAHYFPMMACAMVWSREGARRFVEGHGRIFAPVDNFFRHWLTREGHGYCLWPAPVEPTMVESDIVSSGGSKRSRHERKWYYGFAKQKRLLEDKIIAMGRRREFRRSLRRQPAGTA